VGRRHWKIGLEEQPEDQLLELLEVHTPLG
jgi:hypothetical protein